MGNIVGLDLKIDEKFITETAKEIIQAGVVSALGNKDTLIKSVINSILAKKVDENGNEPRYSSDGKYSLLDVYVNRAVRETAKEVVQEIVEENRAEFKKLLKKQLTSATALDAFAKSFVEGTIDAIGNNYRSRIEITVDKSRN